MYVRYSTHTQVIIGVNRAACVLNKLSTVEVRLYVAMILESLQYFSDII